MSAGELVIVRHGETAWSRSGQHTSVTDIPLTAAGEDQARALRPALAGYGFAHVLVSPRTRARRTAELAGLADPVVDDDLVEWFYGDYEGVTTATVRETVPGWTLWHEGVPGGETAAQVGARVDRVLAKAEDLLTDGNVALVAHSHLLRVLVARWLGLEPTAGALFLIDTGTVSVLSHERENRVIHRLNERG